MVDTSEGLARLVEQLLNEPRIAIDTESNSLYAYQEQVCLVQISTASDDYLIDPLAVEDLSPLGRLLAAPDVEKVFHAAEYDLMCLRRDFDFDFAALFDTMVAARILGWERVGLASILEDHFGVKLSKRYQRANWGERPLTPQMVRYAKMDTRYLLGLRERLQAELEAAGRDEEAREAFVDLTVVGPHNSAFDPDGFWNISGTNGLSPREHAVLRELYLFREELAERRNVPPFKVMTDETLLYLAQLSPVHLDDLHHVRGLGENQVRRSGHALLRRVRRGLEVAEIPRPPRRRRPNESLLARYEALHNWRKERARARGVDSDIVVSKDVLWRLAKSAPSSPEQLADIDGLGPWKRRTYGDEILRVLQRHPG